MSNIETLEREILAQIENAIDESALENVRVASLGKKSLISEKLKTLGKMSPEERKKNGPILNGIKSRIGESVAVRKTALRHATIADRLKNETVDVTLPTRDSPALIGRIHPVTQVIDEITSIFFDMGFSIAEGPEIESEYYNFTALNFPEDHPAREMQDTFFFNKENMEGNDNVKLLRTQTSPVQIRTMEQQKPPIRIIVPGKTYRCDSDATHSPMFHQIEGLVVDKTSNLANLKWTLEEFCKAFFEADQLDMRFRPSFFPFTEPSLEVDIQCDRSGNEIRLGEGVDWMEILGCGMVHTNVLRGAGFDPDIYQGFAWGIGIDRMAMLKYGMPDLRAFFDADTRWLSHYGFRPLDLTTLFGGLSA